jgi:hypothetical protein
VVHDQVQEEHQHEDAAERYHDSGASGGVQSHTEITAERSLRKKIPDLPLFLGEVSFGFGEFGAVRARTANFGQLGIERLCSAGIAGGLRGASGA